MKKISITKVQTAFNDAIKRRDGFCMVRDFEPCCGQMECSHYFKVSTYPALRFHPMNAWTQCSKLHWNHHNLDVKFYDEWMSHNLLPEKTKLTLVKRRFIRYTDSLKAEIIRLCNEDKLDELQRLIEKELGL